MGQTMEHIGLAVLYDFVSGNAGLDADARHHIDVCEQCRSDIAWLQWLADLGVKERRYEPPAWAVTNAQSVFRLKKPGSVTIAKEIVAKLIYDSFSEPQPSGVRRRDLPLRQTLYQTDKLHLDLKIEVGDERGLIIGQVVADKGDVQVKGLNIEITEGGRVVGKSISNALGEFIFQDLPRGNYELQFVLSDTMVKLPPLPLSE